MSLVIDIADAVTGEINAADPGTFSEAFTAERHVLPEFALADLAELKVTVVPKRVEITGSTRAASRYEIAVDIGIQKKLVSPGNTLDTEVAQLCGLVDEIADYLRRRPLSAAPFAAWVGITNEPVYAPEHLAEQRTFTSVLTVIYLAMK